MRVEELARLWKNQGQDLQDEYDEIDKRYPDTGDNASMVMREIERNIAYSRQRALITTTWYEVANMDDQLAKWIIGNCKDYMGEAIKILEILPATSEEMQKVAKDNEFCSSWDELVRRAQTDGVYPYGPGETKEYHDMLAWYRQNVSSNTRYMREFRDKLEAAIKASVAKILEAKAVEESTTEDSTEMDVKVDDQELVSA